MVDKTWITTAEYAINGPESDPEKWYLFDIIAGLLETCDEYEEEITDLNNELRGMHDITAKLHALATGKADAVHF